MVNGKVAPIPKAAYWIRERTVTGRVTDWMIGVYDDWFQGFLIPGQYSPIPAESVIECRGPIPRPVDEA